MLAANSNPLVRGFDAALAEVEEHWTGEDACADNERACAALLQALDAIPDRDRDER